MRQEQAQIVRQISGLGEISDRYDAILCDIWGVLHNGVASFAPASAALASFRRRGGAVVLITNAPRPSPPIRQQVLQLGVPPEAFDAIVTSGDVTIGLMEEQPATGSSTSDRRRDLSLFDAVAEATGGRLRLVALEDAQYALCTGLRKDESETPDDYEPELRAMAARGMTMICANPDIVIHRGETLIHCAGALARRYEELGGPVLYAGKPYAPIYDRALALAERARGAANREGSGACDRRRHENGHSGRGARGARRALRHRGDTSASLHGEAPASPADPIELQRLYEEYALWPIAAIPALLP